MYRPNTFFSFALLALVILVLAATGCAAQVEPTEPAPIACDFTAEEFDGGCGSSGCWQAMVCDRAPVQGDVVFSMADGTRWVQGVNGYECKPLEANTYRCFQAW